MNSGITRYMKGTQERGFILGSVEDIVMTLDDNAMNIQSMSASRFVGPFLERVQKWEKSLSHISEVVDVSILHYYPCIHSLIYLSIMTYIYIVSPQVWMVVQRKWMYLESIFIGGDIRAQLPEEAKKFDNIDKIFKKVCIHVPPTYRELNR